MIGHRQLPNRYDRESSSAFRLMRSINTDGREPSKTCPAKVSLATGAQKTKKGPPRIPAIRDDPGP